MPNVVVRKLSPETHRALKQRAILHGRSTEAEIRAILETTVHPQERLKIGTELAALGKRFGGIELQATRDKAPIKPAEFE